MKYIFFLFFYALGFLSCNDNDIKKVTIFFSLKDKTYDSALIKDKSELKTIEKFLSTKETLNDKVLQKYFLKIVYKNGKYEEYSGNGYCLRSNGSYYNTDTIIREDFLRVINSKLPPYLQQK